MADHIVMPPVDGCECAFCLKRKCQLDLARRLELELYGAAKADLAQARREERRKEAWLWRAKDRRRNARPAIGRYPGFAPRSERHWSKA